MLLFEVKKCLIMKKLNINVEMDGEGYMRYRESRKLKLLKGMKKALPYFLLSFLGVLLIAFLIDDLTYTPAPQGIISQWGENTQGLAERSWSDIGKVTFVTYAPILVILIGSAWVIHGFGFLIIKG